MLSDRCLSCPVCPVCNVDVLWPNGWIDQGKTYHGGRPWPRPHCVRWGPSSLPKRGTAAPAFGPCLLWPNSWIDQDVTWYEGMLRPKPRCVIDGDSAPPPPIKGHSHHQFWPTSVPSGILMYPTVWPQYTNSQTDRQTDRQDRQQSDSIGRTVLQTVAQKLQTDDDNEIISLPTT